MAFLQHDHNICLFCIIFKYCHYVLAKWWQCVSLGQQTLSCLLHPWEKLLKCSPVVHLAWWAACLLLHWSIFFLCHRETLVKKHWFSGDEWRVFLLSLYYIPVPLEGNFREIAMMITVPAITLKHECVNLVYNIK